MPLMKLFTQEILSKVKKKGLESLLISLEIVLKELSKMVKRLKGNLLIKMEMYWKEISKMIHLTQ